MENKQTAVYTLGNRYQIQYTLGTGGMSVVYLAKDLMLERPVALKLLRPDLSSNPEFSEKFRLEAKAAAILSHPNIVTVHDFGVDRGRLFIVMEYVPGQDLKTIIKEQGVFEVKEALGLIIQICMGLGYAHRAGLVHCDVKPHNMIVTPEKRLKITDFGIARALSTINPDEHVDIVWGSPQYFSPEQASGAAPSPASDVYSIGVISYEMLTGQLPFISNDTNELIKMHREQKPLSPRLINPQIPEDLSQIILKVLSKEPSARYRTADQLGRILSSFSEQYFPGGSVAVTRTTAPLNSAVTPPAQPHTPSPKVSLTQPNRVVIEDDQEVNFFGELAKFDWSLIGLGLLTLLVFGGLVPYWLYIWFTISSNLH
jgi:eukaryotic-like serine/threonine-protein kinase